MRRSPPQSQDLLDDPERTASSLACSPARARSHYTPERMARGMAEIYARVAGRGSSAGREMAGAA